MSESTIVGLISDILGFIVTIIVGAVAWAVRSHIVKMGRVIDIVAAHTTEIALIQKDVEFINDKTLRIDRVLDSMRRQLDEVQ